ncbi:hypothetical protein B0A91_10020 [Pseudomonas syringae]|nr:hypothetical protein B1F67_10010 [Pseudomonas syringae]RXU05640.1 hypothetical protein B1F68_14950 [Pseudomonas syringae]RXU12449.1 hypothetical protein BXU05_14985 [Pseudomonas syringae]RXU17420.1 hypothetical protein B1F70_08480 [Pseudomonas syringae]RXU23853.1 hypothetical protein B0A91_10020 [Pseudomonas syringae]
MSGAAQICDAQRHARHSHAGKYHYRATLRVVMPFWTLRVLSIAPSPVPAVLARDASPLCHPGV